jgi:nitroreductase/ferredoxin
MSIDYGRCSGNGNVVIDASLCTRCGLCARVCSGGALAQPTPGATITIDQNRNFGCIACGACMAICPREAIAITGRDMLPSDAIPLSPERATYDQLRGLQLVRRSVREYKTDSVSRELIEQVLDAASTAPMGIPPSEVHVSVFATRESVRAITADLLEAAKGWETWLLNPVSLALLRPFVGKEAHRVFKGFVRPVIQHYLQIDKEGGDAWFYGAPCALYFAGSTASDDADPIIAATYAMLAAESLGLGSCMLGFPSYILRRNKKIRAKYGMPDHRAGLMLVLGYPAVTGYVRGIKRRFAGVTFHQE